MKHRVLLALAVLAVAFVCLAGNPADASGDRDVLLYEINAQTADEGISLHNYGSSSVNLKGYSITDNPSKKSTEGIITFDRDVSLAPGATVTVIKASTTDSGFGGRHTTYVSGDGTVTISSSFALNNTKDDIYLFKGERIVDAFFYGDITVTDASLWPGETYSLTKGSFPLRISTGYGASCWFDYKVGATNVPFDPELKYDVTVTPFLFPESGGIPIYTALESARDSVIISMYQLTNNNVCALLKQLAQKGVEVTVLLEAAPMSGKPVNDEKRYQSMVDGGVTVLLIGDKSNDRFNYVHAKYCLIDDDISIITSENWTAGNLNGRTVKDPTMGEGNRGWGAIIESMEYNTFLRYVFETDSRTDFGDVIDFRDAAPHAQSITLTYVPPADTISLESFQASLTPILAPDNSVEALRHYISSSTTRVYSEQQNLSSQYLDMGKDSPIGYMAERANAGADCRFILGTSSEDAAKTVGRINNSTLIKATTMKDPYVHNKGVICDDTTLLGSLNWTANSFSNNRETMVALESRELTEYFAAAFIEDFERSYSRSGLTVTFTELMSEYTGVSEITVAVDVRQDGSFSYSWELDGKTKTTTDKRTVLGVTVGTHDLRVTVSDKEGNSGSVTATFTVKDSGSSSFFDLQNPLLPIIALIILALIIVAVKASMGKSRGRGR